MNPKQQGMQAGFKRRIKYLDYLISLFIPIQNGQNMSYPIQLRQHKLWYINLSDFLHLQKDDEQKIKNSW